MKTYFVWQHSLPLININFSGTVMCLSNMDFYIWLIVSRNKLTVKMASLLFTYSTFLYL